MNVYVSIGNTDNKLTQQQWAAFVADVEKTLSVTKQHGAWFSRPDAPWQNACWLLEFQSGHVIFEPVKQRLRDLAAFYKQDSIAWAVAETEFLSGG